MCVQISVSALLLLFVFLADCAGEFQTSNLSNVKCANKDRYQVQITKAFFRRQTVANRCTKVCFPAPEFSSPSVCKKCLLTFGDCGVLFNVTQLNWVYSAVDSGSSASIKKTAQKLARMGQYWISFVCLRKDEKVVDPCADNQPELLEGRTFTSILVTSPRRRPKSCIKECTVKPAGHFRLRTSFLLREGQRRENSMDFQSLFRNGNPFKQTPWTTPNTYPCDATRLLVGVHVLKVRFHLEDLSKVTRLWLSFAGYPRKFSISCQKANFTFSSTVPQPEERGEVGPTKTSHTLVVAVVCTGLIITVTLTTVALMRYRRNCHIFRNKEECGRNSAGASDLNRNSAGQSIWSDEGVNLELNEASSVETGAASTIVRLNTTRNMASHTVSSPAEDETENSNGQVAEGFSAFHLQDPGEDEVYSKPQIYMNAAGDYHPYTRLSKHSQTHTTGVEDKMETLNEQVAEGCSTGDAEAYSMPQIYLNAPEDYHHYTRLNYCLDTQDTLNGT